MESIVPSEYAKFCASKMTSLSKAIALRQAEV